MSQFNGSTAQLSLNSMDTKKSSSNLRSSVKDTNNNKKDPTDSTNALFLLAEVEYFLILLFKIFRTLQSLWILSQKVKIRKNFCPLYKQFGSILCRI